MTEQVKKPAQDIPAYLQHTQLMYISAASAIGAELCHFMSRRLNAYAHIIDDFSHCGDLEEVWRLETDFGQQTLKAYSDEAAKLSEIVMKSANGHAESSRH
ncbi:MAG: hypothetical protein HC871_03245 [Rhizobiales bacterium]|nr:hypothetical protein [Hyphomicrobiales bacterium]